MAESGSGLYGSGVRRKRRPRERPPFRDREFVRDSYSSGRSDARRGAREYMHAENREKPSQLPQNVPKQPIILAKPDSGDVSRQRPPSVSSPGAEAGKINLKSRNLSSDVTSPARVSQSDSLLNRSASQSAEREHRYLSKSDHSKSHNVGATHGIKSASSRENSQMDTALPSTIKDKIDPQKPIKILDSYLHWTDDGSEVLEDQTDFLVVGVLGMQGVGKSTIMSYLAGSDIKSKKLIFPSQTQDVMERASNMTSGVDMYVTGERVIFLDAQPILSPSLLEQVIYNDRKMSAEYNGPAVGIEMQSLQIATFFFSVCHVVILVQDWFTDCNLYRFLQSAEMLKLSTPAPSDSTNPENEFDEFYPHLLFVQNKVEDTSFDPSYIVAMTETISNMLKHSKLLYHGSISLSKSMLFPNLTVCIPRTSEINLFLIPKFLTDDDKENNAMDCSPEDSHFENLPPYIAHPDEAKVLSTFRSMVLAIPRLQLTRQNLTEKNWFYYAAKTWDAIKKSQLMSEYNRLLV